MKMERVAEVIRGWPLDGALDKTETVKSGSTLVNGDVVEMQSDGTIDKVSGTASNKVGLVIVGNGDNNSVVAAGDKAVVLWGNYVVKVTNAAGTLAPGTAVTGKNGVFTADAGSDPIIGHVVKVVAVSSTETAHVVIVVR